VVIVVLRIKAPNTDEKAVNSPRRLEVRYQAILLLGTYPPSRQIDALSRHM